jgi:hypothetical protein
MAALDFPDSPTVGQVYDKWTWNGTLWTLTSGGGGGGGGSGFTFVQDTAPTPVKAGDTWFDTSDAASGGTSWVAVSEVPGAAGPLNWVQFAPGASNNVVPDIYAWGKNTTFTMVTNTNSVVWFTNSKEDPYNMIPASGGLIAVPRAGIYSVTAHFQMGTGAAGKNAAFWLYDTRTARRYSTLAMVPDSLSNVSGIVTATLRLRGPADTFYLGYWTTTASTVMNDAELNVRMIGNI